MGGEREAQIRRNILSRSYGYDRRGPHADGSRPEHGFSCNCEWGSRSHGDRCPEHGWAGILIPDEVERLIVVEGSLLAALAASEARRAEVEFVLRETAYRLDYLRGLWGDEAITKNVVDHIRSAAGLAGGGEAEDV